MNGYLVVTDMGAKLDGQTDDSEAWADAINAVADGGGGTIIMPQGISRVTSGLSMRSGVHIDGVSDMGSIIDCSESDVAVSVIGTQSNQVRGGGLRRMKIRTGSGTTGLHCQYARAPFAVDDVTLDGTDSTVGVMIEQVAHELTFENTRIDGFDAGIRTVRVDAVGASGNTGRFRGMKFHGIKKVAIDIDRCQAHMFEGVNIEECPLEECAIRIKGSYSRNFGQSNKFVDVRIGDCEIPAEGADYAIELEGCWGNLFVNVSTQKFGIGALRLASSKLNRFDGFIMTNQGLNQISMDEDSKYNRLVGGYLYGQSLDQFEDNVLIDMRNVA